MSDDTSDPGNERPIDREIEEALAMPAVGSGKNVRKIVTRLVIMLVGFGIAGVVLYTTFSDLDFNAIVDAVRSLTDAEIISLLGMTAIVVWAEALGAAVMVPGLPARRGALAWLAPTAVSSVVPGPSDIPVFYKMILSWGNTPQVAGTAVAANSFLNMSSKLVLPAIAGVVLVVADIDVDGILSTIITATVILAVLIVIGVVVLGSAKRTAAAGRVLEKIWTATLRLLRRDVSDVDLADSLVDRRAEALEVFRDRWQRAIGVQVLITVTRVALFVMCIRFVGVPESAISWEAMFCVWAIVRGLTVIPIMPGNAGVSELAYVGLLTPIAGTQWVNEITAGVLLFRILTWLLMIPAGLAAFGLWRAGLRRTGIDPDTLGATA